MEPKLLKVYAAYRSGCLGNNIFDAYYPFVATIIYEEQWTYIDSETVAAKFNEKYGIELPLSFVNQVLGIGVANGSIIDSMGQFNVERSKMKSHCFDSSDFNKQWGDMRSQFCYYCKQIEVDLTGIDIDSQILEELDQSDSRFLAGSVSENEFPANEFHYAWNKYLIHVSETRPKLYDFIASISASNIIRQAIFYSEASDESFTGLNVYLDSPMVFALLGMDSPARTESCKYLIEQAQKKGCSILLFDHNLHEIEGILSRAAEWARDPNYSIEIANNAARFFHDSEMTSQEMVEFCETIENKLSELNIRIKQTGYDINSDEFQEDENELYDMLSTYYSSHGRDISDERARSISIDVRSIVMVYRERAGQISTKIQNSKDIMLTINSAIANVCKNYESNRSINSGHIPACISADLFGSVMWLFSPVDLENYNKKRLLADCYSALRPTKKMLSDFVESLKIAKAAGDIDEKTFLFMRSHSAVYDALMNVTKGDYARFSARTPQDVYNDILENARHDYKDEVNSHEKTKQDLEESNQRSSELKYENDQLKAKIKNDRDRRVRQRARIYQVVFALLPYLISLACLELLKVRLFFKENPHLIEWIIVIVAGSLILVAIYNKINNWCVTLAEKHVK